MKTKRSVHDENRYAHINNKLHVNCGRLITRLVESMEHEMCTKSMRNTGMRFREKLENGRGEEDNGQSYGVNSNISQPNGYSPILETSTPLNKSTNKQTNKQTPHGGIDSRVFMGLKAEARAKEINKRTKVLILIYMIIVEDTLTINAMYAPPLGHDSTGGVEEEVNCQYQIAKSKQSKAMMMVMLNQKSCYLSTACCC